ncbi:hypothetical protein [Ralstonia pseudosolanacearum]|uniref:hypothetical protein n=1 Tax=Ralstonia pseudosolanacearum TaxID=1310165 RepID=UPI0018D15B5D|nr:hypothetical protein [Ralstonia pseudosolanacearum]
MEKYKNLDGDSGVAFYETGSDHIWVHFSDGMKYRYSDSSAGPHNISEMKRLAAVGKGLNSFINKNPSVRTGYDRKESWQP